MQKLADLLQDKRILTPPKQGDFEGAPKRPSVRKERLVIDNEFFERGYAAQFHRKRVLDVYCVLAKYANHKNQTCFPAIPTIMKETGVKNRNTIINAIKILESYNFIAVVHAKSKTSNRYALLDCRVWKPTNSINLDTILKAKKSSQAVSKDTVQPYQDGGANSITSDTRNHITKLDNEINQEIKIKESSNKEALNDVSAEKPSLSKPSMIMLKAYYEESDVLKAVALLQESGTEVSFSSAKDVLQRWSSESKIKPIKELTW